MFSPLLAPAVTAQISNTFLSLYYLRSQVPLMPVRSLHCLLYLSSGWSLWLHRHIVEGVITWYTYQVLLLTITAFGKIIHLKIVPKLYLLPDQHCFWCVKNEHNIYLIHTLPTTCLRNTFALLLCCSSVPLMSFDLIWNLEITHQVHLCVIQPEQV